jgi:anti-sigma B factor antagonist
MTIDRITENDSITLALSGELTALTAEQLDTAIETAIGEAGLLVLDFKDMEYVASAGLRVLLRAQKMLNARGRKLIIRNVNETVMNVFEITGFSNMLDIQ